MTLNGWYVGPNGKKMTVVAAETTNPEIVDLTKHNLGLVVKDRQFFETEDDADEQAILNAEDTIDTCEELLRELRGEKRRYTTSKPVKASLFTHRKERDPFGPPDYGKGTTIKNKKRGFKATIEGWSDKTEGVILYMVKTPNDLLLLRREELNDYEVVA